MTTRIVIPTVLSRWFLEFREDVLAGRVSLEELVSTVDADQQTEAITLCHECRRYPVRTKRGARSTEGLCSICWLHRLRDAHREKIATLAAAADVATAKKEAQRFRDRLNPDRPRGPAPFRSCAACGERLPARMRYEYDTCPACREIRERRGRMRTERLGCDEERMIGSTDDRAQRTGVRVSTDAGPTRANGDTPGQGPGVG